MRKTFAVFACLLFAELSFCAIPQIPITANFERHDVQWDVYTKVGNTPQIVATIYQGTNLWTATGWTAVFKYGKSQNTDSMVSINGTVSGSTITFPATTNSFAIPVDKWYSSILLSTNGYVMSQADGYITVERSPEVDAGTLNKTYAIVGGLYSFSGTFTNWPFLANGDGIHWGDIPYFDGTNWVILAPGVSGQILQTGGTNAAPSWVTDSSPSIVNGTNILVQTNGTVRTINLAGTIADGMIASTIARDSEVVIASNGAVLTAQAYSLANGAIVSNAFAPQIANAVITNSDQTVAIAAINSNVFFKSDASYDLGNKDLAGVKNLTAVGDAYIGANGTYVFGGTWAYPHFRGIGETQIMVKADLVTVTNDLAVLGDLAVSGNASVSSNLFVAGGTFVQEPSSPSNAVTKAYVDAQALAGDIWYFTTTPSNVPFAKTTNFIALSKEIATTTITNITPAVVDNAYLCGGTTTQMVGEIRSPIGFKSVLARSGGNASSVLPVGMEVYYVLNGTTNLLGDWTNINQNVVGTTPVPYDFSVEFNPVSVPTGALVHAYLKSGDVSGASASVAIYGGLGYGSHMLLPNVPYGETYTDVVNGYTAADTTLSNALQAQITIISNMLISATWPNPYSTNSYMMWVSDTQAVIRLNIGSGTNIYVDGRE